MLLEQRIRVNEAVVCADLDGEAVLLNVETGIYFGLDEVGTAIWKLLEQGSSEDEVVTRLCEDYDVAADQLHADVAEFLKLLEAKGLMRLEK